MDRVVEIQVTWADIREGAPGIMTCCPVARAFRRAVGARGVYVHPDHIRLFPQSLTGGFVTVNLPAGAREFVRTFDASRQSARPITFDVVLPGDL